MEYKDLYELARHCDVICEVGVQRGANFKKLIEHDHKLAVAVDMWIPEKITAFRPDGSRWGRQYSQARVTGWYESLKKETADKPWVKICKGFAHDVVKEFPDEFFDLVYIDADHLYESVYQDIRDWYPKVKTGGYLCGHDYTKRIVWVEGKQTEFGVIRAVDEFVKEKDIKTFFRLPLTVWGIKK